MLQYNSIIDKNNKETLLDIISFIKYNRSLKLLDLSNCRLTQKAGKKFVKAIRKSLSLQSLILSGNQDLIPLIPKFQEILNATIDKDN